MSLTSIVIVNWNTRDLIRRCVQTVRQHTSAPYEIIVVDNGSTDGSADVIKQLCGDDLRAVYLDRNTGYAAGNNRGIEQARGATICLLNSDVFVTAGWLGGMLRCMQETNAAMVGPWTNHCKGAQRHKPKHRLIPRWMRPLREVDYLSFCCVMIDRRVFDEIGLLDERFGIGTFEDDDFCRRARSSGFKLVIDSRSWVWHEAHATMRANKLNDADLQRSNKALYDEKWKRNSAGE